MLIFIIKSMTLSRLSNDFVPGIHSGEETQSSKIVGAKCEQEEVKNSNQNNKSSRKV